MNPQAIRSLWPIMIPGSPGNEKPETRSGQASVRVWQVSEF